MQTSPLYMEWRWWFILNMFISSNIILHYMDSHVHEYTVWVFHNSSRYTLEMLNIGVDRYNNFAKQGNLISETMSES